MVNKTNQGPNWKLPEGQARTATTNGGVIVKGYGKEPLECTYNPDPGQRHPRDPQHGRK